MRCQTRSYLLTPWCLTVFDSVVIKYHFGAKLCEFLQGLRLGRLP